MSMFKKVLTVAGLGLTAGLMSGGQAEALGNAGNQAFADLTVSVTVAQMCNFDNDQALTFTPYDNALGATGQGTFQLLCTPGAVLDIALDAGQNPGGATGRSLAHGSGALMPYSLCDDATCSNGVWGSNIGVDTVGFLGTGAPEPVTVYGLIAGGLPAVSGAYNDLVRISVNY